MSHRRKEKVNKKKFEKNTVNLDYKNEIINHVNNEYEKCAECGIQLVSINIIYIGFGHDSPICEECFMKKMKLYNL